MDDAIAKMTKTILVVDDHPDIRSFISAALEAAGYQVRTAEDGVQALVRQREHPADLLITDIFMPEQDGFETISRCRAEFPRTRIIVMSAGGSSLMKQDYLATANLLDIDATLRKPFDVGTLLETVRGALQAPQ
jgi:two-component system chemotaxis response regulator CheY